ncbi:hemicentin-2-like isoform X2 [Haliotis rufescens]|uniref:hemicentin-2-like isoform X2 n=1 Tax=Haliotis rufescens TaxID=6454 RepID=UPI00201F8A41|nr:hemicentin-2-like isoform X2 [Haliotis rufescens]
MAALPSASTILLAVSLMKGVEGAVTVSGSGGTGIPNQQDLTLRCNYTVTSGDVVTTYTWRKGEGLSAVQVATGSVIAQTAVFVDSWQNKGVFVGDFTSSLDIQLPASHVTSSYAGTYRCEVSGVSGSGQVSVTASVLSVPSISGLPSTYTVVKSSRNRIDCSTYTTPGNPPTTSYTWTYGGSTVSTGAVLDRSNISRSQGRNYTCTASNTQGSDSASVNVDVQYAPSISGLPTVQNVSEFSSLRIDCSTYTTPGNPPTTSYTWTYGGSTVSTGAVLDRISISRNQGGNYTCSASNTLTPSGGSQQQGTATAQINVDVQYQASISMFTANSLSGTLTVNESDSVTLRCHIDSYPRSIIRLLNGTEELTRADNSLTAEYRLESADCRQRGNYSCTATNNIGAPVSQRVELLVIFPPRLDESVPQQLKYAAKLGGNVTVSVSVLAFPLPTFTWSRTTSTSQDLTGSSSPVSDISVTARLHLTNLQKKDFGDYSLTVDNRVGRSVAYTVSLKVEGPPGTPTQFKSLENVTTSSVWLSWQPGFNGGHPQSFMLEYLQFVTRTWTPYNTYDDTGKVKVVEVTGLTSGDIHIFRLHSRNSLSNSSSFVLVETVTAGDPTDHQQLDATCTEDIVGSTVGTLLLALFIEGIVVMVLYRKGFRFGHAMKGTASPKSTSRAEDTEMDNIGYSSLDTINSPAQYTSLEEKAQDKQNYSQLKIYENTKDAPADTSTYEGMAETPRVTYESINASPHQDSGGQPRDAD